METSCIVLQMEAGSSPVTDTAHLHVTVGKVEPQKIFTHVGQERTRDR